MLLQASFLVSKTLNSQNSRKNQLKEKFRAALFWDTDIESIDPEKNRGFIIRRVLERGNEQESTRERWEGFRGKDVGFGEAPRFGRDSCNACYSSRWRHGVRDGDRARKH